MLNLINKKSSKATINQLDWIYQPPQIENGKQTLNEMSPILGYYDNYTIVKTGYLVGLISVSGINLDLLSQVELEDLFADYNAFLMASLGNDTEEIHQYLDLPVPVNMSNYILHEKKRFIDEMEKEEPNQFKLQLMASYINDHNQKQLKKGMATKIHLLALRVKISDQSEESLIQAVVDLTDKLNQTKKDLEDSLNDYDITTHILTNAETREIHKNIINYNGKE